MAFRDVDPTGVRAEGDPPGHLLVELSAVGTARGKAGRRLWLQPPKDPLQGRLNPATTAWNASPGFAVTLEQAKFMLNPQDLQIRPQPLSSPSMALALLLRAPAPRPAVSLPDPRGGPPPGLNPSPLLGKQFLRFRAQAAPGSKVSAPLVQAAPPSDLIPLFITHLPASFVEPHHCDGSVTKPRFPESRGVVCSAFLL